MKKRILIAVLCLVSSVFCTVCLAGPTIYTGELSSADSEIAALGTWTGDPTENPVTLSWEVSLMDSYWHYEYTFTTDADGAALGHFILEASDTLTIDDIDNINPSDPGVILLGDYVPSGDKKSTPSMPDDIYGIKFEDGFDGDVYSWMLTFDTQRDPIWGDFYAVGGSPNSPQFGAAWNEGFTNPDTDPSVLIVGLDDYLGNVHILVPDTTSVISENTVVVPAPGAFLLGGIGVGFVGWLRRRRTL